MGFPQWLRSNSEHYLAIDAQRRIGARYGARDAGERPAAGGSASGCTCSRRLYRLLPWGLRRRVIGALPGSHRREWPVQSSQPQGPAI